MNDGGDIPTAPIPTPRCLAHQQAIIDWYDELGADPETKDWTPELLAKHPGSWRKKCEQFERELVQKEQEIQILECKLESCYHRDRVETRYLEQIDKLKTAIRAHRDQRGDDRCWLDDQKLYEALGESAGDNSLPPKEKFLANCSRFYDNRCKNADWQSYQELESERDRLRQVADAAYRLLNDTYYHWSVAGGLDECKHGYAKGIPCRRCDQELVNHSKSPTQ